MDYKQLRQEVKEREKSEKQTRTQVMVEEHRLRRELPQVCSRCGKTERLTLDHIVPLNIIEQFGVDWKHEVVEGNYRIMCKACNNFKANKLDFSDKRTKELLLKLLQIV